MGTFFKTFLACLLALIVNSVFGFFVWLLLIVGFVSMFSSEEEVKIYNNSILKIDLAINMPDRASSKPLENFDYSTLKIIQQTTLYDAVSLIKNAASDPKIKGIYISVPAETPNSLASLYELRQAIEQFKTESGKFVVAFGDVYSHGGYYVATCADKVYLNPHGALEWAGLSGTVLFYKGLFEKLGVEPEILRHGKFKGAVEPFTLDKLSDENRLQMEEMLKSVWNYVVEEVGTKRSIDTDLLQQYADDLSALKPDMALKYGMVDSLYYADQVIAELSKLTGEEEPRIVTLAQYKTSNFSPGVGNIMSKNHIAVVYAEGDIVDGGDTDKQIVGNHLAAELRKVRLDDAVQAVVLRVNSPGGSVLASDVIWREMELLKEVKPLIVSMGGYAASGGYYISCPANQIVSTPMTITGSIGVFGMMFNVEKGAREKLGLTMDVVKTNNMSDMGNVFRPLTSPERVLMQSSIDSTYVRFVGLVSNGRGVSYEEIDEIAQGRVWSGLQAIDHDLADKVGSLKDAIDIAAESAGISEYRVRFLPEPEDSFSSILRSVSEVSLKFIKSSTGVTQSVDEIKEAIDSHQGVWVKIPYRLEVK